MRLIGKSAVIILLMSQETQAVTLKSLMWNGFIEDADTIMEESIK